MNFLFVQVIVRNIDIMKINTYLEILLNILVSYFFLVMGHMVNNQYYKSLKFISIIVMEIKQKYLPDVSTLERFALKIQK